MRAHRSRKTRSGRYRNLTTEDLQSTPTLVAWHAERSQGGRPPLIPKGEWGVLTVVALAERALEIGSNPPALFINLVSQWRADWITDAQEHRAVNRLREWRRSQVQHQEPMILNLANTLGAK